MTSEFGSLGDGIFSSHNSSSSTSKGSNDLYPNLFASDDEICEESDNFSELSSEARSTPPLVKLKNPLFPQKEFVDHLRPEEIRWFYKQEGEKDWTPFIGYDSLRIECRYRALQNVDEDDQTEIDTDVILVRGGLYQVDVNEKKCKPVYWSGDESSIIQGLWFYDGTYQPLDEEYGCQIETEYVAKFIGFRYDETPSTPNKGPKPVLHTMRFTSFYIEWNAPNEVYLFSEAASSRFVRGVKKKLGMQKAGTKLQRGYKYEAVMEDKPSDISHLVFVIHGIGQKMETGNIIKRSRELREKVNGLKRKFFPDMDEGNQRSEFLPVEWRSSLTLDGDTVDSITPHKMRGVRSILNSSAMDILYYTSPLYRSEITFSLQNELNRLYEMFCSRNPYFEANGGKVSIVAHSLGAVITYDIITAWNPIQLYDQFVHSVIEEEEKAASGTDLQKDITDHRILKNKGFFCISMTKTRQMCLWGKRKKKLQEEEEKAASGTDLQEDITEAKKSVFQYIDKEMDKLVMYTDILTDVHFFTLGVSAAESLLVSVHEKHKKQCGPTLHFQMENLFCLGSPLAVFLALRGIRPQAKGTIDHILPTKICKRLFNIYHPYDPVAYRLEPLILKHYSTIMPLPIHRFDSLTKEPYNEMKTKAYAAFKSTEKLPEKGDIPDKKYENGSTDSANSGSRDSSPARQESFSVFKWLRTKETETMSAELKMLEKMEKDVKEIEKSIQERKEVLQEIEKTDLEYRLDYQLKEANFSNSYYSMLTSHTSYWSDKDVAYFILNHLHPGLEDS